MRTIKFRGKTIRSKEWVYSSTISQGTIKRKANKWFMEISENVWKGLQEGSLGQFTGLYDKTSSLFSDDNLVIPSSVAFVEFFIAIIFLYLTQTPQKSQNPFHLCHQLIIPINAMEQISQKLRAMLVAAIRTAARVKRLASVSSVLSA